MNQPDDKHACFSCKWMKAKRDMTFACTHGKPPKRRFDVLVGWLPGKLPNCRWHRFWPWLCGRGGWFWTAVDHSIREGLN